VTSKRHATVELAFEALPLAHLFDVVVASGDAARDKPYADPLLHALVRLDASPAEACYVGDAPVDVEAARAADIHSVAVSWGGLFPFEQTLAAGPDTAVHTVEELLAVL
jgi:pyrophosphatase PpaX